MKYLKRLWSQFYGIPPHNDKAEAMRMELSHQISNEQRKKVLAIVDSYDSHCEAVSFESFVAGFRLAIGAAAELYASGNFPDCLQLSPRDDDYYHTS